MRCRCRCPDTLCGQDVDDLFAYQTAKSVRIRDHRLGAAYYLAVFGVIVYIGLYSLAYNLAYLKFYDPSGTVRFKMQQPVVSGCDVDDASCMDAFPNTTELKYCCRPGCTPSKTGGQGACTCSDRPQYVNYQCAFYDGDTVGYPQRSGIFVATRIRVQNETLNQTCILPGATSCSKLWSWSSNPTFFVAGIENFTVLIDHAAEVAPLNFFQQARDLSGLLKVPGKGPAEQALCAQPGSVTAFHGGRSTSTAPCYAQPMHPVNQTLDIFTLQMLLGASGVDLDGVSHDQGHSVRYEGMTMMINIFYYNAVPWSGLLRTPGYYYEVTAMAGNSYGQHAVLWNPAMSSRTLLAMHGMLIQANVVGPVAGFDFNNLLLQLTASLALLTAATLAVNFLAMYVLKYRKYYSAALVDETADFSAVVALEQMPLEELREACGRRFLPSGGTRVQLINRLVLDGYDEALGDRAGGEDGGGPAADAESPADPLAGS